MSWLAVDGPALTIRHVTTGHTSGAATTQDGAQGAGADDGIACEFIGSPGGPDRCDHGADHRTAGRLHPSVTDQDGTGAGYPAHDPASTAIDQRSPTARPPSGLTLAELQVWRR